VAGALTGGHYGDTTTELTEAELHGGTRVGGDRPGGTTAQHDRLPGHGSRHGGADDDSRSSPLSSGDFIPPECSLEPLARHVERGSQETNSGSVSQETCTGVVFGRREPSSNAGHRHKHPDLQQGGGGELLDQGCKHALETG
jgi:hypothetical protein